MKELFKKFKQNSNSNTITGLSEKAEEILSKTVELWPILQRPFAQDPVDDAIETDGFWGKIYTYTLLKNHFICHIHSEFCYFILAFIIL